MAPSENHSEELKTKAINLVLELGLSKAEAARILSVRSSVISRWIKDYEKERYKMVKGYKKLTRERAEYIRLLQEKHRLLEETKKLEKENAILKEFNKFVDSIS